MTNELAKIVGDSGLEPKEEKFLFDSFGDFYTEAHKLNYLASGIKVTDISQTDEMEKAREIRLGLKDIRIEADKVRKKLKENYIRKNSAIQNIFNGIRDITKPIEAKLLDQEQFAKRIQDEKDLRIEDNRKNELLKYAEHIHVSLHPNDLSTHSFDEMIETYKIAFEAKEAEKEKIESDRLAKIESDRVENERIRKENEKLKIESDKKDAKLRVANKAKRDAENKLKRAKALDEAKLLEEKEEADRKTRLEEAEVKKKLLAPDKNKLMMLANDLVTIEVPAVKSNEAQKVINDLELQLEKLANEVRNKANNL